MYVDLDQALVFMLVMIRMTGMLITNPILGRRNIPTALNAAFAFILAVLLTASMPFSLPVSDPGFPQLVLMAVKEFCIGMVASFIILMFLSLMTIGGEIVDMQLGIGMAKVFDPGTNSSISLTSTLFNSMYVLIFFCTNNHLTFIRMASQTFDIIPLGAFAFNYDIGLYLAQFLSNIFLYAIKLCMPVVVIEIIVTVAVGLIMKIIPQINIFVVNIQFKLLVGFFALIVLVGPFMAYFENLMILCFEQIAYVWGNLTM